jgi:hypothetical protein
MIQKKPARTWIAGWIPVFPRDKREAFAPEIMLKQEDRADDDTKKSHPALAVTPR